ncbi:MAG: DUF4918 family protein [Saprospiraceae bacterium]|nr:DUF4918 family protein [Saprospiraceae bacterium]MCB9310697.1 DUF4918 family protein [Lewinellaceae bacterium]
MTVYQDFFKFWDAIDFDISLPDGIKVLNPHEDNPEIKTVMETFYKQYYSDDKKRVLVLGINPGRLGAGATGIPFTDPKRLVAECHIPYHGAVTHEPSSVFVYDVIHVWGGPTQFYNKIYINSVCPIGFVKVDLPSGKAINYNYYDRQDLTKALQGLILANLKTQQSIARNNDTCVVLGTGKNYEYLKRLNEQYHLFRKIVPLEHPRYIMQYKSKLKEDYVKKYIDTLGELATS